MFVSVPFRSCSDGDVTFLQTEDALELLQKYSFTILDLSRPSQEKKEGEYDESFEVPATFNCLLHG